MKLRAEIMSALVRYIRQEKLTQVKAAALLGITQPRVSDLMRGRIDRFSLDNLVTLAAVVGLKPSISLKRAA
jgi:predicted XRE-type DNA-binding protein